MTKGFVTAVLALGLMGVAAPSQAQHRSGGGVAGGGRVGVAVPRGSVAAPRSVIVSRPFIGSPFFFGPRFNFGFYAGYPYYYPFGYPYGGYYGRWEERV